MYIGGGFPELYAQGLSENALMPRSLSRAAQQEEPIYAECRGLMYLGQTIEDQEGRSYLMAGIIPAGSSMKETRLTLGYRTVCDVDDNPLIKTIIHLSKGATRSGDTSFTCPP